LSTVAFDRYQISKLKNGDIIFQESTSSQSQAIKLATHSDYSHMGIVYIKDEKMYFYEASATVRLTPFDKWTARGVDGKFVVKRLKDKTLLTPKTLQKMQKVGNSFKGHSYDALFDWSDKKIYCSELVWKIYKRALDIELGELQKLKSFDLSHPAVKAKLKERYGENIPLESFAIAPQGMFDSELLVTVYE
jgi:uncharacterized protein YycO